MNVSPTRSAKEMAARIDHTLLKPEAGPADIKQLCGEAIECGFASVCIHPCHVSLAASLLVDASPVVGSVAGFPFGANHTDIKRAEAAQAIADGAREIDMVVNISAALADDQSYVSRDISAVLAACRSAESPVTLKLILETATLPQPTKVMLCRLASDLGVDYIKTSTGLHPAGGATLEDVRLLYENRGSCKVKAAGGIRTAPDALAMVHAGADRLGTSAGITIIRELRRSDRTTPEHQTQAT